MSAPRSTILVVDDADGVRRLLEITLGKAHTVKTAADTQAALKAAKETPAPDLVLLGDDVGGTNGYEFCKTLKATPALGEVPVIFLSHRREPQAIVQGFRCGGIDVVMKPLGVKVAKRVQSHLEHLARERSAALDPGQRLVARLVHAMEWHDSALGGNRVHRLAQYARALAQAAGARDVACELLAKAAPLHDVGKLAIPPELERKAGALSAAEREQFERHAALGAEIIGEQDDALLKLARTVALTHHECWDGSGYPARLQGNDIPWAGRVMAIVDAFETMTVGQAGRSAMPIDAAAAEIGAGAGKRFDPALVEAFRKALPAFRKAHDAHAEAAAGAADDFLIGAPAAPRPADDGDLTMIGPLRLGATTTSSADKLREAIQRATAKAKAAQAARRLSDAAETPEAPQAPQAPQVPAQAPAKPEPKVAMPVEEPPRVEEAPVPDALKRAQEALAQAQKERAAAEAALAEARSGAQAELATLRARVQKLESENAAANAALAKAQADLGGLQAMEGMRVRLEQLEGERAASEAALSLACSELDAVQARAQKLETEHAAANAALVQAQAELECARADLAEMAVKPAAPAVEQPQSHAEVEGLRAKVEQTDGELQQARAALAAERGERSKLQAALTEAREEVEKARVQIDRSHARIQELEMELAAGAAALTEMRGELARAQAARPAEPQAGEAEARVAEIQAALADLEDRRRGAELALADVEARGSAAQEALEAEKERARLAAEREAAEVHAEESAHRRAEDERAAAQAADERRRNEEALAAAVAARALSESQRAEAAERRLALEAAAPVAAADDMEPPRASGPSATQMVVAFLFGALAAGIGLLVYFLYLGGTFGK